MFRKTFTVPDQGYHVGITVNVSSAATGGPEPGSRYRLFLRGVGGPGAGCCAIAAPPALIEAIDAMLSGGSVTSGRETA